MLLLVGGICRRGALGGGGEAETAAAGTDKVPQHEAESSDPEEGGTNAENCGWSSPAGVRAEVVILGAG